jgi:putative flippase GtrA
MIGKMFANTRFFRFGLVGVANTATDFVLFAFLVQAIGMHVAAANVLSYSAGVLQSFTINSAWTFRGLRSTGSMPRRFAAFCLVNVVSLLVTTALVWLLSLAMPALLAKAVSVGAGFLINFQLSRRLVFAERGPATGEA